MNIVFVLLIIIIIVICLYVFKKRENFTLEIKNSISVVVYPNIKKNILFYMIVKIKK